MKIKLLYSFVMALILVSKICYCQQSAYYDTKFLYENCFSKEDGLFIKNGSFYDVLKKYFPNASISDSILRTNPFFRQYLPVAKSLSKTESVYKDLYSYARGLNVSTYADGIAKFVVTRFKDELGTAFFDKFKTELTKGKELAILFPETNRLLMTIDIDIYQYSMYLIALREAFVSDMTHQYRNLQGLLNEQEYKDYFKNQNPELGSILYSCLYIVNELATGKNPGTILADFKPDDMIRLSKNDSDMQVDIIGYYNALKLFSESFRSNSNEHYWVDADSVRVIIENEVLLRMYLGLIYQKATFQKISFSHGIPLTALLDSVAVHGAVGDSLEEYKKFIITFVEHAQSVNNAMTVITSNNKSEIDYGDYGSMVNTFIDLLDQTSSFMDLPYLHFRDKNKIKNFETRFLYVARTTGKLYVDVQTKSYSKAILSTIQVLDTVLSGDAVLLSPSALTTNYRSHVRKGLLTYGTFIAAISQAQTADDVRTIVESVALPPGSFRVKQKSDISLSVNGYVGYSWDLLNVKTLYMNGIYVPLGVSLSFGFCKSWALSIFGSVLDIGGLAAYRLTNETDTLKQEIKLYSIISPSLQVLIEPFSSPVNLCVGWRKTPNLYYAGNQTFTTIASSSVLNVSMLVDIPFYTIFSTSW